MDDLERQLWSVMSRFERLATDLYVAHVPALSLDGKRELLSGIDGVLQGDGPIDLGRIAAPLDQVLQLARGQSAADVLLVQGLFLEPLGQIVYRTLADNPSTSDRGKQLARSGLSASEHLTQQVPAAIRQLIGDGEPLFQRFMQVTRPLLGRFDPFGEVVDEVFGPRFDLRFSEILGDLSSELLPTCMALGMERKRVVMHLAGSLMSDGW